MIHTIKCPHCEKEVALPISRTAILLAEALLSCDVTQPATIQEMREINAIIEKLKNDQSS